MKTIEVTTINENDFSYTRDPLSLCNPEKKNNKKF